MTLSWLSGEEDREFIEFFKMVEKDQVLQIFITNSLNQVICKATASLLVLTSEDFQYKLPLSEFDEIELEHLYIYVFFPASYDGQTCKGSYKYQVATH